MHQFCSIKIFETYPKGNLVLWVYGAIICVGHTTRPGGVGGHRPFLSRSYGHKIPIEILKKRMGIWDPGLKIREYPMIKDLSWLKISDVFAPNIRQISWNKVSIYQYPEIRIWVADTVPVPGTCTCCSKISKYPNIRSANPLICCKIAKYPNIRSANPLICCKISKYPISESYAKFSTAACCILYPNGAATAQNIPNYPPEYPHGPG